MNKYLGALFTEDSQKTNWWDYYYLTKPKVILLLLLTALVGMCLAVEGFPPLFEMFFANLGIGLLAASGAAFNHCIDHNIDLKMARTNKRPIPQGNVSIYQAATFAASLSISGFVVLWYLINPLTAVLTFISMLGYAVVYTLWLKRATPQNVVIGGLAGAAPPLLGWTAITGQFDGNALLLVMIIFTWTPPHFWALAIDRYQDYKKTGLPMLPITHGIEFTKTMILLYTILLTLVCLLPFLTDLCGKLYLFGSLVVNSRFILLAWQLKFRPQKRSAISVFKFSIYHLMLLFFILLSDHYIV